MNSNKLEAVQAVLGFRSDIADWYMVEHELTVSQLTAESVVTYGMGYTNCPAHGELVDSILAEAGIEADENGEYPIMS